LTGECAVRDLTGKVAVVIGCSAARGTGWHVATSLAAAGARVVVAARSLKPLQTLAELTNGVAVACDISSEEQVARVAATALSTYGRVDIAVNAAGLADQSSIAEVSQAHLQRAVEINFFGNTYFVKHMAKAIDRDGSIIIISSLSTTHPMAPFFAYACAKSATDCLVRYAAREYGPRNIRVNSILPGPIRSDMTHEVFSQPGYVEALEREIPVGRIGEPADFSDAVLWLAGPAYVTGVSIPVCGGIQLARFPYPDELPDARERVHVLAGSATAPIPPVSAVT
jgi:NAD(P)-dependent dehydrogenase (short-subunit alcohol dehydrogenase family)